MYSQLATVGGMMPSVRPQLTRNQTGCFGQKTTCVLPRNGNYSGQSSLKGYVPHVACNVWPRGNGNQKYVVLMSTNLWNSRSHTLQATCGTLPFNENDFLTRILRIYRMQWSVLIFFHHELHECWPSPRTSPTFDSFARFVHGTNRIVLQVAPQRNSKDSKDSC